MEVVHLYLLPPLAWRMRVMAVCLVCHISVLGGILLVTRRETDVGIPIDSRKTETHTGARKGHCAGEHLRPLALCEIYVDMRGATRQTMMDECGHRRQWGCRADACCWFRFAIGSCRMYDTSVAARAANPSAGGLA